MDSVKLDCRVALLGRIAMRIARDVDYCYRCSVVCLYVCLLGTTVRLTKRLSRLRCCLAMGGQLDGNFLPGSLPRLDAFEMKGLRRILRVSWTAKKTNEWVRNKAGVKRELLDTIKARKLAYYGHTMRKQGSCLEKEIMQ